MRRTMYIILLIAVIVLLVGCNSAEPKYEISNDSNKVILEKDYEHLYDRALNAAFANIDIIEWEEYLSAEECKLKVFSDKSAAFLLKTVDKPDVEDNTVMVTFGYIEKEKSWKRLDITYNNEEYGN